MPMVFQIGPIRRTIMRKIVTALVMFSLFCGTMLYVAASCLECAYLNGPGVYYCRKISANGSQECSVFENTCTAFTPCLYPVDCDPNAGGGGTGGGGGGADPSCTIYWWTCDGDPWAT
jgi:hypothetical protein